MSSENTYFARLVIKLKNNRLVAYMLILCGIVTGMAQFTDSFEKLYSLFINKNIKDTDVVKNHEEGFNPSKSLSFAAISPDSSSYYLKKMEKPFALYPFEDKTAKHFLIDPIVTGGNIAFDVTFLNTSTIPIILSEIGLLVKKVAEINIMPLGKPRSIRVQKEDKIVIAIPDIYGELGNKLDFRVTDRLIEYLIDKGVPKKSIKKLKREHNWLEGYLTNEKLSGNFHYSKKEVKKYRSVKDRYRGMESYFFKSYIFGTISEHTLELENINENEILNKGAGIVYVNRFITQNLDDPIYLEPGAPYRLTLLLEGYISNMPNLSIVKLVVGTSDGIVLSEPINIAFMVVRLDRGK